jgi:hypothetical protein
MLAALKARMYKCEPSRFSSGRVFIAFYVVIYCDFGARQEMGEVGHGLKEIVTEKRSEYFQGHRSSGRPCVEKMRERSVDGGTAEDFKLCRKSPGFRYLTILRQLHSTFFFVHVHPDVISL